MTPTSHKDRPAARALILIATIASVVTFAASVAPGQTRPSAATVTSAAPAGAAEPIVLPGGAEWLKRDGGVPAGKLNLSGTGHFIGFPCPADKWFLIAVDIYGSRYGMQPAMGEWQLTVCDDKFKTLFSISKPYALFELDTERWYRIVVPPLEIPSSQAGGKPKSMWLNVAFDCKASRGVHVGYDAPKASNNSKVGMPDAAPENTAQKYDWMVRPVITQNPPEPTPEMGYWLGAYYELRYEEGNVGGMWSQPGFGAAVHFEDIPSDSVFQGFSLYAMRPDRGFDPARSKIDFFVADDSGTDITKGAFPYSQLPGDSAKWVEVESHKVEVPTSFWLVIDPHADTHKWVTFYYDTHTRAPHAKIAAGVGKYRDPSKPFEWMIRAWVRRKIGAKETK